MPLPARGPASGHPDRPGARAAAQRRGLRPIRVAFVVHAMQIAGAEVLVAETIRRLAGRIRPTVFCLDAVGELGARLRRDGVAVICLDRRPGRDSAVAWKMAQHIRTHSIEVLHAHQYTPFFYAAMARVLSRRSVRIVLTEHGRHYPDVVSPLRRAANRLVLDGLADAVNAVCAFSARRLTRVDGFAGHRIEVIENGIEPKRYGPATDRAAIRAGLGLRADRRAVVSVARFHRVKDHATLLRSFHTVTRARSDVELLLVGDGPLRGDLESLVRALGINERVRFLGVRSDVPDVLRAADVFALTSLSEAAPLTVLEAMASGLPVVATAVGGNAEIIRDGVDGLLVPRGDAAAAAAALLRLLDQPPLAAAMGAAGSARVRDRYKLERTIERYYALYSSLAVARAGRGLVTQAARDLSPPARHARA